MTHSPTTLFVVDDDLYAGSTMHSIGHLLGIHVTHYTSPVEFLEAYDEATPGCLILDLQMPQMSGLELQQELNRRRSPLPVIVLSGHVDVKLAVEAMRQGALTVLEKPCHLEELSSFVREALSLDAECRSRRRHHERRNAVLSQLTPKEREVYDLIAEGKTNRAIAGHLQLSVRAVEDRRARLMKKLNVRSVAELVRLGRSAGEGASTA